MTETTPKVFPEIDALLQPRTWVELNPKLNVANLARMDDLSVFGIDEGNAKKLNHLLVREGYFHLQQLPWNLPLQDMAEGIVRLTQRGFPPPFCFVYDEYWLMFCRLHQILAAILGPDYAMLPAFWAWHVDPRAGHSGWSPHRDKNAQSLYPDGRPKSVTVWLPLTEANPLNGCIYIVPAHLDPTYNTPDEKTWKFAYQDIRALPSAAGGCFVWTSEVLHWGSRSSPLAAGPRISLAFEFQRGDIPPMSEPLLKPMAFLSLNQRLGMICQQIVQYDHMYPPTPELKNLVQSLLTRVSG